MIPKARSEDSLTAVERNGVIGQGLAIQKDSNRMMRAVDTGDNDLALALVYEIERRTKRLKECLTEGADAQ